MGGLRRYSALGLLVERVAMGSRIAGAVARVGIQASGETGEERG